MPFMEEIAPDPGIRAGLWLIAEPEEELLALARLSPPEKAMLTDMSHPLRRKQWMACRALLNHMLGPGRPPVVYDPNGKPFLDSSDLALSLSHTAGFAAAAIRTGGPVGVDIEKVSVRLEKVRERFLSADEQRWLPPGYPEGLLNVLWGAKESAYKLQGHPGTDIRDDIHVAPFDYLCAGTGRCSANLKTAANPREISIFYRHTREFMLVVAW